MRKPLIVGLILTLTPLWNASVLSAPTDLLVAHEWGTFTALQDDDGTAIGAINADDEPVPDFVCRTGFVSVADARSQLTPNLRDGKGVTPCHPGVTMRLETPVIYFYLPKGGMDKPVTVHVTFNGGWLTEFYPYASVDAPDLTNSMVAHPPFTKASHGSLSWNSLRLGGAAALTPTDDPVWTAPRQVARAATVTLPASAQAKRTADQTEKFLFYRGVGHLDSPMRMVHDPERNCLRPFVDAEAIRPTSGAQDTHATFGAHGIPQIPAAWLVEIRPEDGFCAYTPLDTLMDVAGPAGLRSIPSETPFSGGDFNGERLQRLREQMQSALEEEGLFPDEAAAMLKTWELSYFKTPGQRVFYIMPRTWTDRVLPLSIEGATITRVMMGRIELVTPAQRASLSRIAGGPCPDLSAFTQQCATAFGARYVAYNNARTLHPGQTLPTWKTPTLAEMNVPVPAIYRDYLNLGRFRDALLLREEARRPTPALQAFIAGNGLPTRENTQRLTLSSFLPGDEHSR